MGRMKFLAILGLIIIFFSCLLLLQINKTEYLYNYDSWYHYYFTEFGESNEIYTDIVGLYDFNMVSPYPSFLRTGVYIFSLITNISVFNLFISGVFFENFFLFFFIIFFAASVRSLGEGGPYEYFITFFHLS